MSWPGSSIWSTSGSRVTEKLGVLVMAYGTPQGLDEVEAYYTDIRRGRPPPPELLEELTDRYRAIGGRSPLLEITHAQAAGIQERTGIKTYLGQKHAAPFIADAVATMAEDGVERALGLVLAPHYSSMSVGDYERRAAAGAEKAGWDGKLKVIRSWHLEEGYLGWLAASVEEALGSLPPELQNDALIVFSAHSLPAKILESGDPYPEQLKETAAAVAALTGRTKWRVGWQSAGRTADPWLGPDILAIIEDEAAAGTKAMIICSAGFVSDHLEVLYDVDIEAQGAARKSGIELRRTRSPNDDPAFLDTLASVVTKHMSR
jgi:ferrochelatase